MGEPLKMAELIASLDGPVFVERVAIYDNKRRTHAKRTIKKALDFQVSGNGFAFVEVLSECPVHWGLEPEGAENWVRDEMEPVFPLGIKKDVSGRAAYPAIPSPSYAGEPLVEAIGASTATPPRFAAGFPHHLDREDISFKFAGAGGDGAQTAAMVLTRCAINEGFDATHIPSYGPQSRGDVVRGRSRRRGRGAFTRRSRPHVLVAFNAPSLARFGPLVRPGGTIIVDSAVIDTIPEGLAENVRVVGVPCATIAWDLGATVVKNIVALGALQEVTAVFPPQTFLSSIRAALRDRSAMISLNEAAFEEGRRCAAEAISSSV